VCPTPGPITPAPLAAAALLDRCADLAIAVTREGSGDAAAGVLPAACRLARQLADYLRAISSYPSSQAMQAEASRFGTQRCRGRLI
jgi:hypothetical protein